MSNVLVDTSIWIEFIRNGSFADQISSLARQGRLMSCGVVKTEVLPFIRKLNVKWENYFKLIPHQSFKDEWWEDAQKLQSLISNKYHDRLGIADLIIMTLCLNNDLILFTKDSDFLRLAPKIGLKVY